MTLVECLVYLAIAGVCGSAARGIAGGTGGGFIAWVLLGLLGALVATSIAGVAHLPAPWTINGATLRLPIVWSIIGGVILVAIAHALMQSSYVDHHPS
jgi:uncharacterized membrane protein YeaQ/YmgE (transglycosylase-associated protein family)